MQNFVSGMLEAFLLDGHLSRCPENIRRLRHVYVYRDWCFEFKLGDGEYWDDARYT